MRARKKNVGGRPRVEQPAMPIYDSMKACAAATGIPLRLMQDAKGAGCDAFRSNRVDLARLLKWIFGRDDDGSEEAKDWSQALARVKTLREEIKLEQDKRSVVPRSFVVQSCQGALAILFGELDRTFGTELPAQLQGKTAPQIRDESMKAVETMKDRLRDAFNKTAEGEES